MKKRLLTTLFALLTIVGVWAENALIATLTSSTAAASNITLRLKATEANVPIKVDWGNGTQIDMAINIASTSVVGKPLGAIKIYGDASKLIYFSPYNCNITNADLTGWSGLQTLDFSSNSSKLVELVLPTEANNLLSLNLNSASLPTVDVSTYTKLTTLICGGSKLTSLILPSSDCALKEIKCTSSGLTSIDTHACNNLEKLEISYNSKMKSFILPDNKAKLKTLDCLSVAIESKRLDVSQYSNLISLICEYCELTSLLISANPLANLTVECGNNYLPMSGLPEGIFSMYYTPQFGEYQLNETYTTNDVIDLSSFYVPKKGVGSYYNAEGILPTFTWYIKSPKTELVKDEDYTVTDGCKFQFKKPITKEIYCSITNSGYPELSGQEAYKTTTTTIEEGLSDPIVTLTSTATNNINLKFKAIEDDLPIQIDWGTGVIVDKTIGTALTTIAGIPAGTIKIYGDASKLTYADLTSCSLTNADLSLLVALQTLNVSSNAKLTTLMLPESMDALQIFAFKSNTSITSLDLSKCTALKSLECASNSKLATLTLPEVGDKLETVVVNNNILVTLDVSRFIKMKTLNCKSNPIKQLLLPSSTDNKLTAINATYTELAALDVSKCSQLAALEISGRNDSKLETLILPENAESLETFKIQECGLTSLDVSKYVNLTVFDCTFNYLTSVIIPENPNNNLEVDCSTNNMIMPNFPEGEKITLYYMTQREKVSQYEIEGSYTTDDEIDLSTYYVKKKGIAGSYYPEGVSPTFAWYVEGAKDALVSGKDYTVRNGCKFQFNKVPEGNVYCVIASKAYPAYQDYNEPFKTTVTTVTQGKVPAAPTATIRSSSTTEVNLIFQAIEDNYPIQIDWGNGERLNARINMVATTVSGIPRGDIKIYVDRTKLTAAKFSNCGLTGSLDFTQWSELQSLELSANRELTSLILPTEIQTLDVSATALPMLNMSVYSKLAKLVCSNIDGLQTLTLPQNKDVLTYLDCSGLKLKTLDVSGYTNLTTLNCSNNELATVGIPETLANELVMNCSNNRIALADLPEGEKLSLTYTPQTVDSYEVEDAYTTEDVIDLSRLHVSKKGVKGTYLAAGVLPAFAWYVEGTATALVANTDYTVTDGCKFQFKKGITGKVYCEITSTVYPDYQNCKTTSFTMTQAVGLDAINANIARVYADNNDIVIVPTDACKYTISTISGKLLATGDAYETVKETAMGAGIYLVHVKSTQNEKVYKIFVTGIK